ncbi:MAG: helix-turn-helix transcriptional regulator [Clostridiales bacterium]|nr:helix-turn-helix transcriptional regulator [Clostridiales bacterium]
MITLLQHQIKIAWNKVLRKKFYEGKHDIKNLAEKAGISKYSLTKILDGKMGTRISTLFPLLEALELDLWLVDKEGHSWRLKP